MKQVLFLLLFWFVFLEQNQYIEIDDQIWLKNINFQCKNSFSYFLQEKQVLSLNKDDLKLEFSDGKVFVSKDKIQIETKGENYLKFKPINSLKVNGVSQWIQFDFDWKEFFLKEQIYECQGTKFYSQRDYEKGSGLRIHVTKLHPHKYIKLTFKLFLLDLWQGETFFIKDLDSNRTLITVSDDIKRIQNNKNICRLTYPDPQIGVQYQTIFKHTNPTLKLLISSTIKPTQKELSYGIKDLKIEYQQ